MFHLRVKIIGRSSAGGRSVAGAVAYRVGARNGAAAMAYRAGEKLRDPNTGKTFDYSQKARIDADGFGILHTEIMLPAHAPEWMADRQKLIDAIEAKETRADAQLLREVEISLPRELTFEQQRELLRAFVHSAFVSRGMVADVAIHDERASDGGRNPHAHVLLTMRSVTPDGFGNKVRAWNAKELLREWRETWAEMANDALASFGHERRLDPRSHRAREIDLEPDTYVGPSKGRAIDGLLHAERQESRDAGKQKNIDSISADPEKLIDAVSREKATFTAGDLGYALRRATALEDDDPLYDELLEAVLASDQLQPIASDEHGMPRYATRSMIRCEYEMARAAWALARRETFDLHVPPDGNLSIEQKQAFLHAIQGPDLIAISGVAGAGKTTTLASIARAFEQSGFRVRGAALAGIAAKNLTDEAGIPATTLAAAFYGWDRIGRDGLPAPIAPLEKGDVFILDEAGLVGSRDISRLLREAEKVGAKVILVGDAQQLQAIDAGAAFRTIVGTHGAAELNDVRRQTEEWQRTASGLFARRRAEDALTLYRNAGAIHGSASTEAAMDQLVSRYMSERSVGGSQLILTHRKIDVAALNDKVRTALRAEGVLGDDIRVTVREQKRDDDGQIVERAKRATFAEGDRILFTKNDNRLGVQNGTIGHIRQLDASGQLLVELRDGREIAFKTQDYNHLELGYATTVHKAQGATYDRTYFLATNRIDAHIGYVAMTRHRQAAQIFYARDQFRFDPTLEHSFGRQRPKDSTLDYLRQLPVRERTERATGGAERTKPVGPSNVLPQRKARQDAPRPELKPSWAHGPVFISARTQAESEPVREKDHPLVAPTEAAAAAEKRILENAEKRRNGRSRDRGRDRSFGD